MDDAYDLHSAFGYQVCLLARTIDHQLECKLATLGVTRMMFHILVACGDHSREVPSDIAKFIGISRAALSRSLGEMEGRGLLIRGNDLGDGRMTRVVLTNAGHRIRKKAVSFARLNSARFIGRLDDSERAEFNRLVKKLLKPKASARSPCEAKSASTDTPAADELRLRSPVNSR